MAKPDNDSLFEAPPMAEQERMVEAILFATADPVSVTELTGRMPHGCDPAEALAHVRKRYAGRGVHLIRIGDAWAFRTAGDLGFLMQKETVETRKLSRAAIETLAIVAYHQPATRAEIEEIRGVSVSRGTVDQLIEMEWVRIGRRRMTPGPRIQMMAHALWCTCSRPDRGARQTTARAAKKPCAAAPGASPSPTLKQLVKSSRC